MRSLKIFEYSNGETRIELIINLVKIRAQKSLNTTIVSNDQASRYFYHSLFEKLLTQTNAHIEISEEFKLSNHDNAETIVLVVDPINEITQTLSKESNAKHCTIATLCHSEMKKFLETIVKVPVETVKFNTRIVSFDQITNLVETDLNLKQNAETAFKNYTTKYFDVLPNIETDRLDSICKSFGLRAPVRNPNLDKYFSK